MSDTDQTPARRGTHPGVRRVIAGSVLTWMLAAFYLASGSPLCWYAGAAVFLTVLLTAFMPAPLRWNGAYHWNWGRRP